MNLELRLQKLETVVFRVYLAELSNAELSAHIDALPFESVEGYAACLALVLRHPSTFPIAKCVPHGSGG